MQLTSGGSSCLFLPTSNFCQRIRSFLKVPLRLIHLCDHSFLYSEISFYSTYAHYLLVFFFLINSVLNARYIKRNGIQSFSGVVPGLVTETDKTQYGALTAEISTGSDTRTDRGLKEGQTRAVREKLQMPFKRRGCLNWVNKERGEGCPRPSAARRCQKAQEIRKPSSKGQWMSYRGGHTVRRK